MNQLHFMFLGGGVFIIGLFVFFFGFFVGFVKTPLEQTVLQVESIAEKQTAWVSLEPVNDSIAVVVHNPDKQNIQSVQLAIAYNPAMITVQHLRLPENPVLELAFAGKGFEVDEKNGFIFITAGFAGKAENIPERFLVAQFTATKQTTDTSFFSFPENVENKASQIIVLENDAMVNILNRKKLKNFGL